MEISLEQREKIIEQIKKFMYEFDFSDDKLKTITPTYLKSVLFGVYSKNCDENPYSIIVADFNKLNEFNKQYGTEEADRCIKRILEIINSKLPAGSMICRNGGDEFLIIIPGVEQDSDMQLILSSINEQIKEEKENLHGLTVCMGFGNWKEADSLKKLHEKVDKKVDVIKLEEINNSDSKDNEDNKEDNKDEVNKYGNAFGVLYNILRLSDDFSFPMNDIRKIIKIAINTSLGMVDSYLKTKGKSFLECIAEDEKDNDEDRIFSQNLNDFFHRDCPNDNDDTVFDFNSEDAKKLKNAFIHDGLPSEEELKGISNEQLLSLLINLVYCNSPSAFSKDYYKHFLNDVLPDDEYNISLFNLSGLKLANFLFGHSVVDSYLENELYANVKENIDGESFRFDSVSDFLFLQNSSCLKIYLGGGDLLYIETKNRSIRPGDEYYKKNHPKYFDKENPVLSYLLKYVKISSTKPVKKSDIDDFINRARRKSLAVKDDLKNNVLNSAIARYIAYKCLLTDLQAYCQYSGKTILKSNDVIDFMKQECMAMVTHKSLEKADENSSAIEKLLGDDSVCYYDFSNIMSYSEYLGEKSKSSKERETFKGLYR